MTDNKPKPRILIIEDDPVLANSVQRLLNGDYETVLAPTAEEGIRLAEQSGFDVILTDLQMPGMSGMDVLKRLQPANPRLPIILMTAYHTTATAIEATRLGAYDYVFKSSIDWEEFLKLIARAVASREAGKRQDEKGEGIAKLESVEETMVGKGPLMREIYKAIGRVAASRATVLIRGETGTGKEVVARTIHRHSKRSKAELVIVNCVAIPETLLEAELFGYEPGAFSGAHVLRVGKFEQANQGTIFLDEVGDMSLTTQVKLLRVLEERAIRRLGGSARLPVDVRVLAATNCELERAVSEGRFREDLYYRLNDAVIRLPPLRDRQDDIEELARTFLLRLRHEQATPPSITPEALRFLRYLPWPGNVRQLKNVVQKAAVLARGYPIDRGMLKSALNLSEESKHHPRLQDRVAELLDEAEKSGRCDVERQLKDWAERELYDQANELAEGDKTQVAKWLGVSRPTVRERLARFELPTKPEGTHE